MILKRIVLHNYRQHRDLTVDFTGNLIAVVGRNGSGKSNFLGAIQFALTGEQPGFTKDDLLTWGEDSGYVDLTFDHSGVEHRIQRRIEKPAATLTIGGKEKITGTKKVQDALDEIVGVDKEVLRQSVFVRQTQIDACLFDDSRTREQGFQKLLGLGDAAKYNKFLTDFLSATEKPFDRTQEIATYKENIAEKERMVKEAEERLEEKKRKLAGVKSPDEANAEILDLNAKLKLVSDAKSAFASYLAAYKNEMAVTEKNKEFLLKERKSEKELQDRLQGLNEELADVRTYTRRNAEIERARRMCDEAEAEINRIGKLDDRLNIYKEMSDQIVQVSAHKQQLERLSAETPDKGNICPLCGSVSDHNIKEELERAIANDKQREKDLNDRLDRGVVQEMEAKTAAEHKLKQWRDTLESLGPWTGCRTERDVLSDIQSVREDLAMLQTDNRRLDQANTEFEIARRAREAAEKAKDEAFAKLPHRVESPEILDTAEKNINARMEKLFEHVNTYSALKADVSMEEGGLNSVKTILAEMYPTLQRLEALQEKSVAVGEKLKVIEDVKNWFKYSEGPRTMTQSVMALLTDEVNKNLAQFGSVFSVVPMSADEGMGFRCIFNDGRKTANPPPEASMLSGGQKIQLAVSFRLAVYAMFASKLGLLSLDEPTAYLDDGAISNFAEMLVKIKELAKNMGIQILISTHEAALGPVFDQTIAIS